MEYTLGVIGLGHWFSWLTTGIGVEGGLDLKKAVGTKPFDEKKELLSKFGITENNYYISDQNGNFPGQFFEGINIVHISDPNKFHKSQAIESLNNGKYVIVEKTIAANEQEFNEIKNLVQKNNYNDRLYLHLHYLHKQPTIALRTMLPDFIKQNGKIKSIQATFFEDTNKEDPKRTWLLALENGGIFMDWIHSFEVIYYTTKCNFGNIIELKSFVVNASYDSKNPTGIESKIVLKGANYAEGAFAVIRSAKGVDKEHANKSIKFVFESDDYLLLCFPGHEVEFNTEERGRIQLISKHGETLMSQSFTGMNSSEIFIEEIIDFCKGKHKGLKMHEIEEIFKPQWEYQKLAKSSKLILDSDGILEFLEQGISGMACGT
ncbi:MAG: Gfo/Idh/MocA family oxidoreductase [Candidatus Micrarchaeaceae archaeon]|jgi:predicted dehydrogenase